MTVDLEDFHRCLDKFGHYRTAGQGRQVLPEGIHKAPFQSPEPGFTGHREGPGSVLKHQAVHPSGPRSVDDAGKVVLHVFPFASVREGHACRQMKRRCPLSRQRIERVHRRHQRRLAKATDGRARDRRDHRMNVHAASMTQDTAVFDSGPTKVEQVARLDLQRIGHFVGDRRFVPTGRVGKQAEGGIGQIGALFEGRPRIWMSIDGALCVPAHRRERPPRGAFHGCAEGTGRSHAIKHGASVVVNQPQRVGRHRGHECRVKQNRLSGCRVTPGKHHVGFCPHRIDLTLDGGVQAVSNHEGGGHDGRGDHQRHQQKRRLPGSCTDASQSNSSHKFAPGPQQGRNEQRRSQAGQGSCKHGQHRTKTEPMKQPCGQGSVHGWSEKHEQT